MWAFQGRHWMQNNFICSFFLCCFRIVEAFWTRYCKKSGEQNFYVAPSTLHSPCSHIVLSITSLAPLMSSWGKPWSLRISARMSFAPHSLASNPSCLHLWALYGFVLEYLYGRCLRTDYWACIISHWLMKWFSSFSGEHAMQFLLWLAETMAGDSSLCKNFM